MLHGVILLNHTVYKPFYNHESTVQIHAKEKLSETSDDDKFIEEIDSSVLIPILWNKKNHESVMRNRPSIPCFSV